METQITHWLSGFALSAELHGHVAHVLLALPDVVRDDLLGDPAFVFYDYEPGPRGSMQVPLRSPGLGAPSRSVVLKRTLARRPEPFIHYVIAHELAHAYLRNEGRFPGEDPEFAADSLAEAWGFGKPDRPVWS